MDLEEINREYVVLTRMKTKRKIYIEKWWEGYYFDCPNESETQAGIVLSTSLSKQNRLGM